MDTSEVERSSFLPVAPGPGEPAEAIETIEAIEAIEVDPAQAAQALERGSAAEAAEALEHEAGAAAAEAPERAAEGLTRAAALWAGPAGDPRRAARALRAAIELAPLDERAVAALVALYRENDKHRSLVRILERRAEAIAAAVEDDSQALRRAAEAFALVGDQLRDPPLSSAAEALSAYRRAIETGAATPATFAAARALCTASGSGAEALSLFAREREGTSDPARVVALFREEAEARAEAGDRAGASEALRRARAGDPAAPGIDEALGASLLARLEAGDEVPAGELCEGAEIFAALAEEGGGEAAWRAAERCFEAASRWEDAAWAAERRGDPERALALLGRVDVADPEARVRVGLHEARLLAEGVGDARRAAARYAGLLHELPPGCEVDTLERLIGADRGGNGALGEVAARLEAVAVRAIDVRALKLAFGLSARAVGGAARGAELVRQAEVLTGLGADRSLSLAHAEAGLAGLSAREAEPLLDRLVALATSEEAIALHERQIARAASDDDRLLAIDAGARLAVKRGTVERIQRFFVHALSEAASGPVLDALERAAQDGDRRRGNSALRGALAVALDEADPSVLDGGRTRAAMLRRAATIARRDLGDPDQAFERLGDALFARLEGALDEALGPLGDHVEELGRAAAAVRDLRALLDRESARRGGADTVPPPASTPAPPSTRPTRPPPPPPVPRTGARPALELADPFPASRSGSAPPTAPVAPPPSRRAPPLRRLTGEELLADLFESMHAIGFCKDSIEAAAFTVTLAMEKLGCAIGLGHLYNIDRREYVVVHARGPHSAAVRDLRTSDADPLAAEAMASKDTVLVLDAATDPRASGRRWEIHRAASPPVAAIACARAVQAGRYLGLIELGHLEGSEGFADGDDNALTYIASCFAAFVSEHGIVLPDEG